MTSLPTSIRLTGELERTISGRRKDGEPAITVLRRDIERYYQLLRIAATDAGKRLSLCESLMIVGEDTR